MKLEFDKYYFPTINDWFSISFYINNFIGINGSFFRHGFYIRIKIKRNKMKHLIDFLVIVLLVLVT